MKKLLTFIMALIIASFMGQAFAEVVCHTPRMNKVFKIDQSKIAVYQSDVSNGREIASMEQARTLYTSTGFTKVMQHMGHKVTLHIEDTKQFSDLNDYLVIRDQQGHEMTYPLNCYQK